MTAADLDALDALARAATAGPWGVDPASYMDAATRVRTVDERIGEVTRGCSPEDAAYIVAACNALPELVAEARAGRRLAAVVADPGAALRRIGWARLSAEARERGAHFSAGNIAFGATYESDWLWECDVAPDDPAEPYDGLDTALRVVAAIWREPAHAVLARLLP